MSYIKTWPHITEQLEKVLPTLCGVSAGTNESFLCSNFGCNEYKSRILIVWRKCQMAQRSKWKHIVSCSEFRIVPSLNILKKTLTL